jgi:Zn-dependent peptidase ImmA (M78 family)/predicted secreted protein
MARDYAGAVRTGAMAASRLHRDLGLRETSDGAAGAIDIFAAINVLELPLMLRPLKGLMGAFLNEPCPGILIGTGWRMSIQRFTAAHELGHCILKHRPSLDDEDQILRRVPLDADARNGFQETEADAFAVAFMMPKWLIVGHCARQGWRTADLVRPSVVYQLSLRLGASYEATCRTLERYRLVSGIERDALLNVQPRPLKVDLLRDYRPTDYKGDVWLLTERDQGARIDGSRNDLFVVRVEERSAAGYVWNFEELAASGFAVVRDVRESSDPEGVGSPVVRRVTATPQDAPKGRIKLSESRPWQTATPIADLAVDFDLTGPEELGYSRAERRRMLEAA